MVLLFNYFLKFTGWLPWLLVARPKVHYEDRAVQGRRLRGAAIVISNHTSVWDFGSMVFLFPFRILRCVVAELMYEKNPFMTFFLKGMGCIRVDRNTHDFSFLPKCAAILKKGGVVELYPESRINPDRGELLPFKPSVAYLALETGAPVIPVYTDGAYFSFGRNHVAIGKPVDVRQLYDDSLTEAENITAITNYLRGKIHELKVLCEEQTQKV